MISPTSTNESRPQIIRDYLRPEDRKAVQRIVAATDFFRPDEIDVATELVDERLAKGKSSGYEFVFVEIAGVVAGYVCYGPIPCTLGSFDLYWIAVDPKWQRCGLGQRLIFETERKIKGWNGRHVYIETSGIPKYASTRAFYERCGYSVVAEMPDFYAVGDSKVVWRKVV